MSDMTTVVAVQRHITTAITHDCVAITMTALTSHTTRLPQRNLATLMLHSAQRQEHSLGSFYFAILVESMEMNAIVCN